MLGQILSTGTDVFKGKQETEFKHATLRIKFGVEFNKMG